LLGGRYQLDKVYQASPRQKIVPVKIKKKEKKRKKERKKERRKEGKKEGKKEKPSDLSQSSHSLGQLRIKMILTGHKTHLTLHLQFLTGAWHKSFFHAAY